MRPRALQRAALETEMWRGPEQVLPGLRWAETRTRIEDAATVSTPPSLVPPPSVAGARVFSIPGISVLSLGVPHLLDSSAYDSTLGKNFSGHLD